MKKKLNYLKGIVIVHGKSEKQICEYIKNNLKLNIHIESEKSGEKSIQITSVNNILKNLDYKNEKNFLKKFNTVEMITIDKSNKKGSRKKAKEIISNSFKIFIIMDTDDCTEKQKNDFKSKEMFKDHWAYPYIIPIYNDSNLEEVMVACGIKFTKKGNGRKKEYIKIFPTDKQYIKQDTIQIKEFYEKLAVCPKTNMDEFVKFCLDMSNK